MEHVDGRHIRLNAKDECVAIIPARGGSKRIPRKNIRLMSGKPLIAWAIEAALQSGAFDQVVVSTDDDEIARIATQSGATVPFKRPNRLSDDYAATTPVLAHAISELRRLGYDYEMVCCIYPSAVFIEPSDYVKARTLLNATANRDFVVTIARYMYPVQRALNLHDDSTIDFVDPAHAETRTQDLPDRWHDAGQFYWGRSEAWLSSPQVLNHAVGYPLRSVQVQDIDTLEDWERAAQLHALRLQRRP